VQDVASFELRFGVSSSHARFRKNGKRGFYLRKIGFGFILILGVLLTTYAIGSGSGKPLKVSDGGIEGKVVKGPMCPVERIDQPCPDKPLEADIEIQGPDDQDNKLRIRSGKDGRFRIALAPGNYKLTPMAPNPGAPPRAPGPQSVTVESGKYTQVTIKYDSGIR
jgi:hypothetical protein